jgi:mRNA interferase RelE/StbE
MYRLVVAQGVLKELGDVKRYPAKVFCQIALKIFGLTMNPRPPDSEKIGDGYRVNSGEYRIYYEVDDKERTIAVLLVAKRGDDEIYRRLKRKFGG